MAISSTKGPIQVKRGTAAQWAAAEAAGIILLDGELGYDDDVDLFRVGDGATPWSQLSVYGGPLFANVQVLLASAQNIFAQIQAIGVGDDARTAVLVSSSTSQTRIATDALYRPSTGTRPVGKGELLINVKDFGAVGDGVTDDTAAIQAAINSFGSGGLGPGNLYFPPGDYLISASLVLHSGLTITGLRDGYGYLPSGGNWTTRIKTVTAIDAMMLNNVDIANTHISGIDFDGGGVASRGISYAKGTWCSIRHVHMNNFLDSFIWMNDGFASVIDDFLGVNGLRRPAAQRTALVGSIELGGSDHFLTRIETGGGYTPGALTSGGFNAGFVIRGGSIFGSHLVSEFSEVGFYFTNAGVGCMFTLSRSDKGGTHGWVVAGTNNMFSACTSANMAREADATYSGFRVTGRGNVFSACRVFKTGFTPNTPLYAFEDQVTGGTAQDRTAFSSCTGVSTSRMIWTVDFEGGGPTLAVNPIRVAANVTTADVTNAGIVYFGTFTQATTVTNFSGGVNGQKLVLLTPNSFVTIANNGSVAVVGSIFTSTGAAKTLAPNKAYAFTYFQGIWYENSNA